MVEFSTGKLLVTLGSRAAAMKHARMLARKGWVVFVRPMYPGYLYPR